MRDVEVAGLRPLLRLRRCLERESAREPRRDLASANTESSRSPSEPLLLPRFVSTTDRCRPAVLRRPSAFFSAALFFAWAAGAELLTASDLPVSTLPASDLTDFLAFLLPAGGAAAGTVSTLTRGRAEVGWVDVGILDLLVLGILLATAGPRLLQVRVRARFRGHVLQGPRTIEHFG